MRRIIVAFIILCLFYPIDAFSFPSTLGGGPATVATCGTTPSISGGDASGTLTIGTGAVTACTINFSHTYTGANIKCAVIPNSATAVALSWTTTTSAVSISLSVSLPGGILTYLCWNEI